MYNREEKNVQITLLGKSTTLPNQAHVVLRLNTFETPLQELLTSLRWFKLFSQYSQKKCQAQ